MRVVAGKWRGRVLQSPKGDKVRPTTDRVKEALFSMIGPRVSGSIFVDLCCGAGGLGIEALSRGCQQAYLVDISARSLAIAQSNLEKCGADKSSYQLIQADSFAWLKNWVLTDSPFIIVSDPPYASDLVTGIFCQLLELAGHEFLSWVWWNTVPKPPRKLQLY